MRRWASQFDCGMNIGEQFLAIAHQIFRDAATEAQYRTVINRCYYAAYRHLLDHPCTDGIELTKARSAHQQLIEFLADSDDAAVQHVSDLLRYLHRQRLDADYSALGGPWRAIAEDCVATAEEIIGDALAEYVAGGADREKP